MRQLGESVANPPQAELDASARLPEAVASEFADFQGTLDSSLVNPQGLLGRKGMLPGWDGLPFRGPVPNIKNEDSGRKQPETGTEVHVDILNLAKPDDLANYTKILQMISNRSEERRVGKECRSR